MTRTSTATKQTILACLERNAGAARTKAMARFAKQRLDEYKRSMVRPREWQNPMERFCENAERIHGGAGQSKQPETSTPLDGASC